VIDHFFSDGTEQRKILSSAVIEELERDFMFRGTRTSLLPP
jgi:hypothetical protein